MLFVFLFLLTTSLYSSEDGVQPYEQKYEQALLALARPHIFCLASTFTYTEQERDELVKSQVLFLLKETSTGKRYAARVYMHQGKPVGFITYGVKDPWYKKILPQEVNREIGPDAMLHHLVVHDSYAGKGYGRALVKHAFEDLKKKQVNKIDVWTTGVCDRKVEDFYCGFGFDLTWHTKFHDRRYTLRLQPHPLVIVAQYMLRIVKKVR